MRRYVAADYRRETNLLGRSCSAAATRRIGAERCRESLCGWHGGVCDAKRCSGGVDQRSLARVAFCKVARDVPARLRLAHAFSGCVAVAAAALTEQSSAWSEIASELQSGWMPKGSSGVKSRVRGEIMHFGGSLHRCDAHGGLRGRSWRIGKVRDRCGNVRCDGIRVCAVELFETRHQLVHDVDHSRLLARLRRIMLPGCLRMRRWLLDLRRR